ncbi:MAG TPA: YigZ family protein [Gemmatimonadota bacterium]|nr:YigZ family protein [Gemmatimonadota bacterium]
MRLLLAPCRAELLASGSKFLALAHPAGSLDDALAVRDAERRRHHDATHHVYAARLGDGIARFDDDGEPSGTGGRPVLAELEARELIDTVVVVTRWFGGTKLGTGGLARAYGGAAAAALDAARTRRVVEGEIRYIVYEFGDTGAVARVLDTGSALRGPDEYGSGVRTEVRVPRGSGPDLDRRLRDATAGRARLVPDDTPDSCWITVIT